MPVIWELMAIGFAASHALIGQCLLYFLLLIDHGLCRSVAFGLDPKTRNLWLVCFDQGYFNVQWLSGFMHIFAPR